MMLLIFLHVSHNFFNDKESKMSKYIVHIADYEPPKDVRGQDRESLTLHEETWQLLGTCSIGFNLSNETVSEMMNFLANNMELPANYVAKHLTLLQISLEKIMKPRCLVW